MREDIEIPEEMGTLDLTRRQVVFGGFSALLLAVVGFSCKKEKPKKFPDQTHAMPVSGNEWQEDFSVQIPRFEILDRPFSFPKPPNVHMSDPEFQEICRRIGYAASQVARGGVTNALRMNPQNGEKIIMDYLAQTAGFITASHPEIAEDMRTFHEQWDRNGRHPIPFQTKLNQYLNPGGYHIEFQSLGRGQFRFNIFPIKKTFMLRPEDNRDALEIPVLELWDGIIPAPLAGSREGEIASCDVAFQHIIVFSGEIDSSLAQLFSTRPSHERFQQAPDLSLLRAKFYRSFLRHEATHIMMARRFPRSGQMAERNKKYEIPLSLRIGGVTVDLSGRYPPVAFQELCGIGSQLALTEIDTPIEHGLNIRDASDLPAGYELIGRILPLVTVDTAPETPVKQNLLRGLEGGFLDLPQVIALLGNHPSSPEHTRRAGEILYRIGYSLLERAERGDYRLVESMQ